jgi:hypothetical protein
LVYSPCRGEMRNAYRIMFLNCNGRYFFGDLVVDGRTLIIRILILYVRVNSD